MIMAEHIVDIYANQIPILPGEYLPGYISRLSHMMPGTDKNALMSFSGSTQLGRLHQVFPRVVSCFAYRETEIGRSGALLKEHMGSRLWRGFMDETRFKSHIKHVETRTKSKKSIFIGEELISSLKPMKFCNSCAQLDRITFGVAYWHATHQLTSVFNCHEHNEPLQTFHLSHLETLLDYPAIAEQVVANSTKPDSTPLKKWIQRTSEQFMAQPTVDNRLWVKDLQNSMFQASKAKTSGGQTKVNRELGSEWKRFLRSSLNELCPQNNSYFAVSEKNQFGFTQQIQEGVEVANPYIFLLALKFTEDSTGFKVS